MNQAGPYYIGGSIEGVRLPQHFDFNELRLTPAELRAKMDSLQWSKFIAFQTRNPMHRAHIELTVLAQTKMNLGVLIHPVSGMTKPGDVDYAVRVRCYLAIVNSGSYYQQGGVELSLLPIAMRMAGPREALWHAIIRKNYGASHFIVGRDHAGCKSDITGKDFYGTYDAQELVSKYEAEVGIEILKFSDMAYVPSIDQYVPVNEVPKGAETLSISGTKFRAMMNSGAEIPEWFSHPDVIKILREVSPPLDKRGFSVFFTGLSGSGKTTITSALIEALQGLLPTRRMTILDGDVVRTHLSAGLGFSIPDRNTNVARMGWVAAEVVRHGGIAICSTISPFDESREESRQYIEETGGGFILVHISTSVDECTARDVKGLYQQAKKGLISLTGVSHPYEFPDKAELTIDAGVVAVESSVDFIIEYLIHKGYIKGDTVPAKYTTIKPEIVLKANRVLTEGVVDPASLLCASKTAPHVGAVVSLVATDKVQAALTARGFTVEVPTAEEIAAAESAAGAADTQWVSTTLSTPMKEAQIVEAGWGCVRGAGRSPRHRTAGLYCCKQALAPPMALLGILLCLCSRFGFSCSRIAVRSSPAGVVCCVVAVGRSVYYPRKRLLEANGKSVAIVHPRLLVYAATMLRVDPCFKLVVVTPLDARVNDAKATLLKFKGAQASQVDTYLQELPDSIAMLKKKFPERVIVLTTGDAPEDVAAALA